jgi:hypothetical protein
MAIDFNSGSNSLFPRLGRCGKALFVLNPAQSSILTLANDLLGRYPAADQDLSGSVGLARAGLIGSIPTGWFGSVQQLATQTVLRMVAADQPTRAGSIGDALAEIVRQMNASTLSVKKCTVGQTTTPYTYNLGTGQVLIATKRGDGLDLENLFAETANVTCVADAVNGGAVAGSERFAYTGTPAGVAQVSDYNWPLGSGATANGTNCSALVEFPSGPNLLVNSSFDRWTGATVDNWIMTGTYSKETSLVYRSGGNALRAAVSTTPTLYQEFANTAGTTATVPALTSIGFAFWIRGSAALSGGNLRVELVDSTGTAINDATGSPARVDFALSGTGTTYTAKNGIIRTPLTLPSVYRLRINTQAAPVGGDLILDHFAACRLNASYAGGPGWATFAGSADWRTGDGASVVATNDRGGASNLGTFQTLFDRLFNMRQLGLLLPSNASPTIADTLITS